jgi:predicted HTH transcriptional regulator
MSMSIPINIETLLSGKVVEGSPVFDTDEPDRRYFVTEFKIHPDFVIDDATPDEENRGLVEKESGGSMEENGGTIGGQMGGQMGGQISLTTRQKQIAVLIKNNPKISRIELAQQLKINESAIQKHLNALKRKGVISRIGGTRGYWQISQTIINE